MALLARASRNSILRLYRSSGNDFHSRRSGSTLFKEAGKQLYVTLLWALVFFLVVSLSLVHASCKSQACPEAASFLFLPEFELAYG